MVEHSRTSREQKSQTQQQQQKPSAGSIGSLSTISTKMPVTGLLAALGTTTHTTTKDVQSTTGSMSSLSTTTHAVAQTPTPPPQTTTPIESGPQSSVSSPSPPSRQQRIVQMVRSKSRSLTRPRLPTQSGQSYNSNNTSAMAIGIGTRQQPQKVKNKIQQHQQQQRSLSHNNISRQVPAPSPHSNDNNNNTESTNNEAHNSMTGGDNNNHLPPRTYNRKKLLDIALIRRQQSFTSRASYDDTMSMMKNSYSFSSTRSTSHLRNNNHNHRNVFHVRLSIGYLTGLRLEEPTGPNTSQGKGGKGFSGGGGGGNNISNHLVLGFVELAQSGKFMAISQPLLPNITGSKMTRVVWASPKLPSHSVSSSSRRGGDDGGASSSVVSAASKARRRLHFAIPLERDVTAETREAGTSHGDYEYHDNDDLSTGTQASYVPEVVHLLIGLKCGDERIPLGVAKLVVSGRETMEQKMDLAVQPYINTSEVKPKRRLFGHRKKNTTMKNSFTNGDHSYVLAPNATLRVKADIKSGTTGQTGSEVWGNDDSSYATNWTYDTSTVGGPVATTNMRDMPDGSPHPTSFLPQVESPDTHHFVDQEMPPPSVTPARTIEKYRRTDKDSSMAANDGQRDDKRSRRSKSSKAPLKYIDVTSPDDISVAMSGLTATDTGWDYDWCITLCGDRESSKDQTKNSRRRRRHRQRRHRRASNGKQHRTDWSERTDRSDASSFSSDSSSDDDSSVKVEHLQGMANADCEVETLDVTAKQYNDLKEAQQTLLRYSSKIGVPMEDLLTVNDKVTE